MTAFTDRVYGELLLHPPPLTYAAVAFIMPVFCSSRGMENMSKLFSYFMYWVENILFGIFFFIFELLLAIPTYFKVFHNIILNAKGGKLAIYLLLWTSAGIFICIFVVLEDCKSLFKICFEMDGSGELASKMEAEGGELLSVDDIVRIQNEVRETGIVLFKIVRKSLRQQQYGSDSSFTGPVSSVNN